MNSKYNGGIFIVPKLQLGNEKFIRIRKVFWQDHRGFYTLGGLCYFNVTDPWNERRKGEGVFF